MTEKAIRGSAAPALVGARIPGPRANVLNASSDAIPGSALARLQDKIKNTDLAATSQAVPAIITPAAEPPMFFDHVAMASELAKRRRRKLRGVMARVSCFILAPVVASFVWFANYATPMFSSQAEFVVQKSEGGAAAPMGGMLGAAAGMAGGGGQDAIMLQSFLTSRDAMDMLERDHGFKAQFSGENIDILKRLTPESPREDVFELYEKMVRVGYDPTEGLVQLEVISPDPQVSKAYAESLISYAEERIDSMTLRMREHQMADAKEGYLDAEKALRLAQDRVITLQEAHTVLPAEAEAGLLSGRAGEIEGALTAARLALTSLERNKAPNQTRLQIAKSKVSDLEAELARVRSDIKAPTESGASQAAIQGEIALAKGEVEARLAILAQAAQQMEASRLEASKQMRFISVSVTPGMTDVAAYPEIWKNTGLSFLAIFGLYIAISLTGTVLREQVNS